MRRLAGFSIPALFLAGVMAATASQPLSHQEDLASHIGAHAAEHHHGDADDRHTTPDSPCHHEVHCCCAPASVLECEAVSIPSGALIVRFAPEIPDFHPADRVPRRLRHIPKA